MPGANVQEVDAQSVDLRAELAETIELALQPAPVVLLLPVFRRVA
jgi:hypothetical protein